MSSRVKSPSTVNYTVKCSLACLHGAADKSRPLSSTIRNPTDKSVRGTYIHTHVCTIVVCICVLQYAILYSEARSNLMIASFVKLVDWFVGWSIGRIVGWLVGWWVGWVVGWVVGWLEGWLFLCFLANLYRFLLFSVMLCRVVSLCVVTFCFVHSSMCSCRCLVVFGFVLLFDLSVLACLCVCVSTWVCVCAFVYAYLCVCVLVCSFGLFYCLIWCAGLIVCFFVWFVCLLVGSLVRPVDRSIAVWVWLCVWCRLNFALLLCVFV